MQPRARRTIGIAVALFLLFGPLSPVLADWRLEWEKLVSAAKKEGKVVVYMHSAFQPINFGFFDPSALLRTGFGFWIPTESALKSRNQFAMCRFESESLFTFSTEFKLPRLNLRYGSRFRILRRQVPKSSFNHPDLIDLRPVEPYRPPCITD